MLVALLAAAAMVLDVSAPAAAADAIESDLAIAVQGAEKRISLDQALALLNVPSVSVALIDGGRVAFARAYGKDATPETLYQAASLYRNSSPPSAPCVSSNRAGSSSMWT